METQNRENIGKNNASSDLKEFAALYGIGEKVTLEKLINLMQQARDAEVTGVSFSFGPKRRYNLAIPHYATDGTILEVIRIANIKETFIGAPNPNDFKYNDQVAKTNREIAESLGKRIELLEENLQIAMKALQQAIEKTEAGDLHYALCNAVEEIKRLAILRSN